MSEDIFKKVVSHCKEYGFVFTSSEIYDNGLGAVYDYGQNGVELKNNLRQYWWKFMVQTHDNIVGLDAAIFMHPKTWKASGHIDGFSDPMIDNKDSKKRYRADNLLEDKIAKYQKDGKTNKADELQTALDNALLANDLEQLKTLIEQHEIACPISGTRNWTDVRQFNLMFSTEMGAMAEDADKIYLRPETAQGIFVNFLNVQKSGRMKIPFGIAQTGKAFRNEIIARQFIMRMREFEQMEMQFFVRPGEEMKWYAYWKDAREKWHKNLGLGANLYRFHDHIKLAHYANAACDIEYNFPMGFKELEGIHSRTDFDLKQHEQFSGKKLQFFDPELNQSYVPYVVETSVGLDRMFLSVLSAAYQNEKLEDGSERVVLRIPAVLAPYKAAVLPLVKKDGLPEKAREIMKQLQFDYSIQYDEKDSIGKRYRRQDAIGTPFSITIDHQTLTDNMVTVRDRDTMEQIRIGISDIEGLLAEKASWKSVLSTL